MTGTAQGDLISLSPNHAAQERPGDSHRPLRMPWSGFPQLQAKELEPQAEVRDLPRVPRVCSLACYGERALYSLVFGEGTGQGDLTKHGQVDRGAWATPYSGVPTTEAADS